MTDDKTMIMSHDNDNWLLNFSPEDREQIKALHKRSQENAEKGIFKTPVEPSEHSIMVNMTKFDNLPE